MKRYLSFLLLSVFMFNAESQKVIFLHHSTGGNLYNQGNVAQWITNYNSSHSTNYQVTDRYYPETPYPWANYPYDYWNLWINNQCNNANPNIECMDKLAQNYDVIVFKHCFPGALIEADNGSPSVSSSYQTLANYKLQYRALRTLMDSYPTKKFILWTLAPLHRLATTPAHAARSKEFVDWVKNAWLTEDGKSHPNIYIFDFFNLAAETSQNPANGLVNCLKYVYEGSHTDSDSHPNLLANQTIGPLFAEFIVNTIRSSTNDINDSYLRGKVRIFPNPASELFRIEMGDLNLSSVKVEVLNSLGKTLMSLDRISDQPVEVHTSGFVPGYYFVKISSGSMNMTEKILIAGRE